MKKQLVGTWNLMISNEKFNQNIFFDARLILNIAEFLGSK